MKAERLTLPFGILATLALGQAAAQDSGFTSQFPIADCHFSTFGGGPHFFLDPGRRLVLRGRREGVQVTLALTVLNETKEITLPTAGGARKIVARVVEEMETADGELTEITRNFYARCLETGDVYHFGEEVAAYEGGAIVSREGSWEAGLNDALPGLMMPRTFLLGARYLQELAPDIAMDQAEHTGMTLTVSTPFGTLRDCVQVTEHNPLEPGTEPAIKTYAPGIGLVEDDGLLLEEFHLGQTDGAPTGCTFVPFSNHPFFPLSPGRRLVLEGREDGKLVVLTITVLDAVKATSLAVGGEQRLLSTRVVEERETKDGELRKVTRQFVAQCVETGDVYHFGEEVDRYVGGGVVGHQGTWLAGVAGAQPGLLMPGNFVVGAQYFRTRAPGVTQHLAVNSAAGLTVTVPAGTFTGCVTVTETNILVPDERPETKAYAPGVGLIDVAGVLKLTEFVVPGTVVGLPVLSIQDAVLLTWPLTEQALRVETSADLRNWVPVAKPTVAVDGRHQTTVPRDAARKFFRLALP
jgi:hypothetical protein